MIDDDMLAAVRECLTTARGRVAGEQLAHPAGAIISRARRRRLRRGLSAAVAAAVLVAVMASAQLPRSGGQGPVPVRLAAWTVIRKPGGEIRVTIRELRDLGGLQRWLRADGVAATVSFSSFGPDSWPVHRPCYYPRRQSQAGKAERLMSKILPQDTSASRQTAFTINPFAIPAYIGLWIEIRPPARHVRFVVAITLVYAGRCPPGTGSVAVFGS